MNALCKTGLWTIGLQHYERTIIKWRGFAQKCISKTIERTNPEAPAKSSYKNNRISRDAPLWQYLETFVDSPVEINNLLEKPFSRFQKINTVACNSVVQCHCVHGVSQLCVFYPIYWSTIFTGDLEPSVVKPRVGCLHNTYATSQRHPLSLY